MTTPPGAVPPRRRRLSKQERQAAIVRSALEQFAAHGFAATRIEDVARLAGVAKGTVYLYFPSKEQLFEAVVLERVVPSVERLSVLVNEFDGPADDLLRLQITAIYETLAATEVRQIVRLLIAEAPRFPALVDFYHRAVISRGLGALKAAVERGVRRGEFRPSAVTEFPQVLIAPAIVAAVWRILFEERRVLDLDGYRQAHLDMLLNGVSRTRIPEAGDGG